MANRHYLNTPVGNIPFDKEKNNYYNKLSNKELMEFYIKERKTGDFINPYTFEVMKNRNLILTGDKLEDVERRFHSMDRIKKGDIVKTALSETTLVLEVKENKALLFGNNQFVVANNFQKENDRVHWGYGDYYEDLPKDPFRDIVHDDGTAEKIIMNILNNNYKTLIKTLMRTEHYNTNEEILNEVYYKFLENDVGLLSDWFEEEIKKSENENKEKKLQVLKDKIKKAYEIIDHYSYDSNYIEKCDQISEDIEKMEKECREIENFLDKTERDYVEEWDHTDEWDLEQ